MTSTPGQMDYDGPMHIVHDQDVQEARGNRTAITTLCGITYVPTPTIVNIPNRGTCVACMENHEKDNK